MEDRSWRRNHGVEETSWRTRGGENMEKHLWRKNHGKQIMEKESWRRNHGVGIIERRRNHGGEIEEERGVVQTEAI